VTGYTAQLLIALYTVILKLATGIMCEIYAVPRKHFSFEPEDLEVPRTMSLFCGDQYRFCRYTKTWKRQVRCSFIL
jgi:hypothetical protein